MTHPHESRFRQGLLNRRSLYFTPRMSTIMQIVGMNML
jgi:hypothetical protein